MKEATGVALTALIKGEKSAKIILLLCIKMAIANPTTIPKANPAKTRSSELTVITQNSPWTISAQKRSPTSKGLGNNNCLLTARAKTYHTASQNKATATPLSTESAFLLCILFRKDNLLL